MVVFLFLFALMQTGRPGRRRKGVACSDPLLPSKRRIMTQIELDLRVN
jgi:hypothetical protein